MNNKNIKDTAMKHAPKSHKLKNTLVAFVSGGTLAIAAQLLFLVYNEVLNVDKDSAVSMTIVTIIIIASLLTGLGLYDKAAQTCGAGLFVPISGFANSLTSCALEGKSEGLIYGIGGNMFKLAGSVLTYGISSAFVFGMIRFLLFGA
ncbi:SpoVA/SpoVAEb family sporulation membrane protein [Amedibacillus sp. YH-ame10]